MANLAYIQLTRTCNQECRFCSNPPLNNTISFKSACNLINKYILLGYKGIIFSGGEPTLYPRLPDLIAFATKKKFPARIITNGQKTAYFDYLKELADAGLRHINLSIHSDDPGIQGFLSKNKKSLENIKKTLSNIQYLKLAVDIATVLNKYNANHLSRIVKWVVRDYPFIRHFIWNNLDPSMNRATQHTDTIPKLADFESELYFAMSYLEKNNRSFRVERVPLCYMSEFAYASTEARKIVKKEKRAIFFLDKKGLKFQKGWLYAKAECCSICSLTEICPGLYMMGQYFSSEELFPVFVSKKDIIEKIKKT